MVDSVFQETGGWAGHIMRSYYLVAARDRVAGIFMLMSLRLQKGI